MMTKSRALIAALLLPVLAGFDTASLDPRALFATAVPFCRLMTQPAKYVDVKTAVSGLYAPTPHGGMLYGKACPNSAVFISAKGVDGEWTSPQAQAVFDNVYREDGFPRPQVPVVAIGVLRSNRIGPHRPNSTGYELEEVRIIAALAP